MTVHRGVKGQRFFETLGTGQYVAGNAWISAGRLRGKVESVSITLVARYFFPGESIFSAAKLFTASIAAGSTFFFSLHRD